MRIVAFAATAVIAAASFGVIGVSPVHAQTTKTEVKKVESDKKTRKVITVKSGDYLSKIAKVQKSTVKRLYFANKSIKDPDLIFPGQKLKIPGKNQKLASRPMVGATIASTAPVKTNYAKTYSYRPVVYKASSKINGGVWDKLAACESGGNWATNTGNGYYGGLQFTVGTWHSVGGTGYPNQASKAEQIARAKILQARSGWGQWPACTARIGLR